MRSLPATALVYGLIFTGVGVSLPFAGLWFEAQGLSGAEIAMILATPMLARVVTGPFLAIWADGLKLRRTALFFLGLAAAAAYAGALLVEGVALWLPLWFVASTASAAMIPLSDALTLRLARRDGFVFAWPRGVGSFAFIVANVAMGLLLTRAPVDAILVWVAVAAVLSGLAAFLALPREPVLETGVTSSRDRLAGLGRLVADPAFMTAVAAVGFIHASHAFYYGFSAIIWTDQGVSERDVGLLWGVSVAAELVLLWLVEPWRRRSPVGPSALLIMGAVAAAVRWAFLAMAPPLWALWPLQALHALSFAAVFIGGLEAVERLSPSENATAAQMVSSSLSAGLLMGMATLLAGPLFDAYGTLGYAAMGALALLGLICALGVRRAVRAAVS